MRTSQDRNSAVSSGLGDEYAVSYIWQDDRRTGQFANNKRVDPRRDDRVHV